MTTRNTTTTPDNTFDAAIKALRPFMSRYSIASGKRVKLHVSDTASAEQLNAAIAKAGKIAERGGGAVYVHFEMSNEDAQKIVAREFGEAKGE